MSLYDTPKKVISIASHESRAWGEMWHDVDAHLQGFLFQIFLLCDANDSKETVTFVHLGLTGRGYAVFRFFLPKV